MVLRDSSSKNTFASINFVVVSALLFLIIVGMLFAWHPWNSDTSSRTIDVTGEATITATPDQFVFYPSYQLATMDALNAKSNEVVAGLEKLGISSNKIKTDANATSTDAVAPTLERTTTIAPYMLQITVTVNDEQAAQKVQNYLATTSASGAITPYASFSQTKEKELQNEARTQATQDAKTQADKTAKQLGFSVGKVASVNDTGFGGAIPLTGNAKDSTASTPAAEIALQPGEQDLTYSITVKYFIK